MSRCTVLRSLLIALLCLGALAARPARASLSINSITAVPNPAPATGGAIPIYVDCSKVPGGTSAPSGSATLTDGQGTVLSQNTLAYYGTDSSGNPIVYTFLVVPQNFSATSGASYSVNVAVSDALGDSTRGSTTLPQSHETPITIDSLSVSPSPLPSTGGAFTVHTALTCDGPGQSGFYKGSATVFGAGGQPLDSEPLLGPQGTDGNGNPVYCASLSHVPANTTGSPQTYSVSLAVEDNLGVVSSASAVVVVSPAKSASATYAGIASITGQAGKSVVFGARLRQSGTNAALCAQTMTFLVDGKSVGTALTSSTGLATLTYLIPSSSTVGGHALSVAYVGSSAWGASSAAATLMVAKPSVP